MVKVAFLFSINFLQKCKLTAKSTNDPRNEFIEQPAR